MAFERARHLIDECLSNPILRLDGNAFTRQRKLGPKWIVRMLLEKLDHSIQSVLDSLFMDEILPPVSKQAFSKARKDLNPAFVREFADMTAQNAAQDDTLPTYLGMRLIAIDGSDLALENSEELKQVYGCSDLAGCVARGRISVRYGL